MFLLESYRILLIQRFLFTILQKGKWKSYDVITSRATISVCAPVIYWNIKFIFIKYGAYVMFLKAYNGRVRKALQLTVLCQ